MSDGRPGFEGLIIRLKPLDLYLFEPAGQDGRSCLLLAGLDQVKFNGLHAALDHADLRGRITEFLIDFATLVLDDDATGRSITRCDELCCLRDAGPDTLPSPRWNIT